jgi:hypothetical protein
LFNSSEVLTGKVTVIADELVKEIIEFWSEAVKVLAVPVSTGCTDKSPITPLLTVLISSVKNNRNVDRKVFSRPKEYSLELSSNVGDAILFTFNGISNAYHLV